MISLRTLIWYLSTLRCSSNSLATKAQTVARQAATRTVACRHTLTQRATLPTVQSQRLARQTAVYSKKLTPVMTVRAMKKWCVSLTRCARQIRSQQPALTTETPRSWSSLVASLASMRAPLTQVHLCLTCTSSGRCPRNHPLVSIHLIPKAR